VTTEDAPQVAMEIDLYNDRTASAHTLRLCNRGPLFSIHVPSENYEPALITPLRLGTAISVQTYGQPARLTETDEAVELLLDADLSAQLFDDAYHWVGAKTRVYSGQPSSAGFREDLALVFNAVITDISHDTKRASIRMGDASIFLDVPLVTDLYPSTALDAIVGKTRPQAWGTVFCIEPVLIDDANVVFEISRRPIIAVLEARVGGVPWASTVNPSPGFGEYYVNATLATIRFGSGLLGGDVRLDVHATNALGIGALATQVLSEHPAIDLDGDAMAALDVIHPMQVGVYARDPINCLAMLDDIFGGAGAGWGIDHTTGLLTAWFIDRPAASPEISTPLDSRNIVTASLSQSLPPAWRLRVEYERHWQTESQYFTAVTPADKQRWSSTGLTVTREDATILTAEPRAFDVPTIRSVATLAADASRIADRFWNAWNERRQLIDVSAAIDPSEITPYGTIALDYLMFNKNYRIVGATPSIGGGAAQLRLWG
jgi:hypothetical protein